jgi:hypothetical protein
MNEQTSARLTFEQGYLTLHEWIPTLMEISSVPATKVDAIKSIFAENVQLQTLSIDQGLAHLQASLPQGKALVYRECIQAGIRELVHVIRGSDKRLSVTGADGLSSLDLAIEALRLTC